MTFEFHTIFENYQTHSLSNIQRGLNALTLLLNNPADFYIRKQARKLIVLNVLTYFFFLAQHHLKSSAVVQIFASCQNSGC